MGFQWEDAAASGFRDSLLVIAVGTSFPCIRSPSPTASADNSPLRDETVRWFHDEIYPHEPALRGYVRRNVPSATDADDVVQDIYVRMLHAQKTRSIRSGKALLFAVARNVVTDFFRRRKRVHFEEITETSSLAVLESEAGLTEKLCQLDELALLTAAVNALPPRCRQVILLRKINGMSQRDIAAKLGISENTVESLASKGVRRVTEFMRAHGAIPTEPPHVRK